MNENVFGKEIKNFLVYYTTIHKITKFELRECKIFYSNELFLTFWTLPFKKNFSAHMRKSCTFDLKKCLNYKKRNHKIFKKKRFPKKSSASSINYCTYLSKKTLWTKICVNEWLLQKMKKKIHYRLHAYFLNFTLILAFWFKIPKYSFFFCLF